ncbi:hypothetical protein RCL1_001720 [Eukaryota sp. TZLM3-RCL]
MSQINHFYSSDSDYNCPHQHSHQELEVESSQEVAQEVLDDSDLPPSFSNVVSDVFDSSVLDASNEPDSIIDVVVSVSPSSSSEVTLKQDVFSLLKLAWPSVLFMFFTMLLSTTDSIMVGRRLGTSALASVALASTIGFITLWIPASSSFALDALCNQAVGAQQHRKVGAFLQQGLVVAMSLSILPMAIYYFATPIYSKFGFSESLANQAGTYLRYQVFSVPFFPLMFILGSKVLECQSVVLPQVVVYAITNVLNFITNYIFLWKFDFGIKGAAVATGLSRVWPLLFIIIYHKYTGHFAKVWSPWSKSNLTLVLFKKYLKIALPAVAFFILEISAFTIWTLFASMLGETSAAVHAVLMSTISQTYTLCLGLAIAVSIRIGHLVGEGHGKRARRLSFASIALGGSSMAIMAILIFIFKDFIPTIFVDDQEVISKASRLMLFACAFQIGDGIQALGNGCLRGLGKTYISASVAFITYYLVSVPVSYFLSFKYDWNVTGLWTGLVIALNLAAVLFTFFVYKTDFDVECNKAKARLNAVHAPITEEVKELDVLV